MQQHQAPRLGYETPETAAEQRSWAGLISLGVALLLSPVVVLSVFVNDTTPEALRPFSLPIAIVSMLASVAWPAATVWHLSGSGKPGRKWAILGLAISLVGWGFIVFAAIAWVASGGLPSGVGVH